MEGCREEGRRNAAALLYVGERKYLPHVSVAAPPISYSPSAFHRLCSTLLLILMSLSPHLSTYLCLLSSSRGRRGKLLYLPCLPVESGILSSKYHPSMTVEGSVDISRLERRSGVAGRRK